MKVNTLNKKIDTDIFYKIILIASDHCSRLPVIKIYLPTRIERTYLQKFLGNSGV